MTHLGKFFSCSSNSIQSNGEYLSLPPSFFPCSPKSTRRHLELLPPRKRSPSRRWRIRPHCQSQDCDIRSRGSNGNAELRETVGSTCGLLGGSSRANPHDAVCRCSFLVSIKREADVGFWVCRYEDLRASEIPEMMALISFLKLPAEDVPDLTDLACMVESDHSHEAYVLSLCFSLPFPSVS